MYSLQATENGKWLVEVNIADTEEAIAAYREAVAKAEANDGRVSLVFWPHI